MRNRRNIRESEIANNIELLHKEKGIPKSVLIEIFEIFTNMLKIG